jgi:two-component system response regulator FlrC
MILQAGTLITDEDLGLDMLLITPSQPAEAVPFQAINSFDGLRNTVRGGLTGSVNAQTGHQTSESTYSVNTTAVDKPTQLGDDLKQREFEIIVDTLKEEKGSRKNTAQRLGISPRTLRYKLAKMREVGLGLDGVTDLA